MSEQEQPQSDNPNPQSEIAEANPQPELINNNNNPQPEIATERVDNNHPGNSQEANIPANNPNPSDQHDLIPNNTNELLIPRDSNLTTSEDTGKVLHSDELNDNEIKEIVAEDEEGEQAEIDDDKVVSIYPGRTCIKRWFGKVGEGSLRGGTFALVACSFGAGCFTCPFVIMNVGIIPAIAIFTFTSVAMTYTLELLLEAGLKMKIYNYNELAGKCIGKFWLGVYDACNIIDILGTEMAYLKISYGFIESFCKDNIHHPITNWRWLEYLIVCLVVNVPLCLLKDISKLQYASLLATFMVIAVILLIGVETPFFIMQNVDTEEGENFKLFKPFKIGNYAEAFASFMYSFAVSIRYSEVLSPSTA